MGGRVGLMALVGGDRARSNEPLNPLRFFVARVVHGCDWAARACGGGHSPPGRPRLRCSDRTVHGAGVLDCTNLSTCEACHVK